MRKINLLLSVITLLLVVASCSKEKRIERHLHSKDGKWVISKYTVQIYENGFISQAGGASNAGNIVFEKNGTFVWTNTINSEPTITTGIWANTASDISLIANGETEVFHINDHSRRKMQIQNVYAHTDANGTYYEEKTTLEMQKL